MTRGGGWRDRPLVFWTLARPPARVLDPDAAARLCFGNQVPAGCKWGAQGDTTNPEIARVWSRNVGDQIFVG